MAEVQDGEAQDAFERGNRLFSRGDLDGALDAYREADEAGHPIAATCVGLLSESRNDLGAAREAYERADERGDRTGAMRLGLLLSRQGDWSPAQEAWDRAAQRDQNGLPFDPDELLKRPTADVPAASGAKSAFANPVLIGAVTSLIVIVAVFLAYTANAGLPFVPTKELKVDIANGSDLVVGNDVVEGGFRVGLVSNMKPIELPSGQVGAELTLKLSEGHSQVQVDSTITIRPRSVLGTKFVQLNVGTSKHLISDGGTLSISRTSVPVQIDDVFKTFDPKTRSAIQQNLAGYGDALTARGAALNDTFATLPQLLAHLEPVARYLAAPSTELTRLLQSLDTFTGAVAPVAQTGARLFGDMATTFEAISRDPNALESTIAQTPGTLDVSTDSLRAQQPFLADLTTLGGYLTPATASLKAALPVINPALEAGARTLARTPVLNAKLQDVMNALKDLTEAPGTNIAVNGLSATATTLNPMLRYLGPYVTVCDDWNYFWTYLSEHISEATTFGFAQRALLNFGNPTQPNNVDSVPATQPANGGGSTTPTFGGNEYLHSPNYGAAIDNQGNADCETGQRGYPLKLNHFDPKGRNLDTDQHTPGDQGPTFAGRTRVPAGETFSRSPETDPPTPVPPLNPANP